VIIPPPGGVINKRLIDTLPGGKIGTVQRALFAAPQGGSMVDKSTSNLEHFIIRQQRLHPEATGEFSSLFSNITFASKIISREVSKAGLVEILGMTGKTNVQGEAVQKLDAFAQETIVKIMMRGGTLCVMASEEQETVIPVPEPYTRGKYVLVFDPLDGSSNIDANVSIGTLFGIYRRKTISTGECTPSDVLQPAKSLVAAGYIVYGSSTMLVYTTGQGVHGFTLDPSVGEFLLSHEEIEIPKRGSIYSCNETNFPLWSEGVRRYVADFKAKPERQAKSRYIGSLVADFHRTLLYGGIFLYPRDKRYPTGKLRLLYEAGPLSFLAQQAGGRGSDGVKPIVDIVPDKVHQRTSLFIGSEEDILEAEDYIKRFGDSL